MKTTKTPEQSKSTQPKAETDANEQTTTATPPQPNPTIPQDQKLMVLAVCRGRNGQMVITPIDVEHDTDDLTPMANDEMAARKKSDQVFSSAQQDMMKALGALYEIFSRRLYRNQFRTFENFCFAMYDTHRINDALMKKVHARVAALKTDVTEGL